MNKDDAHLIAELCDIDEGLSSWEVEFVESLARQVEQGRELTERQRVKAEEILERLR